MHRCFIPALFVLFVSLIAPLSSLNAETLSDAEVLQQLGTRDALAWERALSLKAEGLSQIDTGKRLQQRKPSTLRSKEDVDRDKADGAEMVSLGEAKVAQADEILESLRAKVTAVPVVSTE
ncbi:MAG: hypothetical protein AAGA45_07895, partial [Verrucomicrobiota bacterium]